MKQVLISGYSVAYITFLYSFESSGTKNSNEAGSLRFIFFLGSVWMEPMNATAVAQKNPQGLFMVMNLDTGL